MPRCTSPGWIVRCIIPSDYMVVFLRWGYPQNGWFAKTRFQCLAGVARNLKESQAVRLQPKLKCLPWTHMSLRTWFLWRLDLKKSYTYLSSFKVGLVGDARNIIRVETSGLHMAEFRTTIELLEIKERLSQASVELRWVERCWKWFWHGWWIDKTLETPSYFKSALKRKKCCVLFMIRSFNRLERRRTSFRSWQQPPCSPHDLGKLQMFHPVHLDCSIGPKKNVWCLGPGALTCTWCAWCLSWFDLAMMLPICWSSTAGFQQLLNFPSYLGCAVKVA